MTTAPELSPAPARGAAMWQRTRQMFFAGPVTTTATVVLIAIIVMAIAAPLLAPHDPIRLNPAMRLKPPSDEYLLGTDAFGRDLLSRIIYGARISLAVGVGAAILSVALGLVIVSGLTIILA